MSRPVVDYDGTLVLWGATTLPVSRDRTLRLLRTASEKLGEVSNALLPLDSDPAIHELRLRWLDEQRALALAYGRIEKEDV